MNIIKIFVIIYSQLINNFIKPLKSGYNCGIVSPKLAILLKEGWVVLALIKQHRSIISLVLFLLSTGSLAQTGSELQLSAGIEPELPPLHVLIDSAIVNSPMIKQQDATIKVRKIELEGSKYKWLDYIGTIGEAKYGSLDNFIYTGSQGSVGQVTSTLVTTRYNMGLQVSLSILDVIQQKKIRKIATENVYIAQWHYDELIRSVREDLILKYNQFLLTKNLLKLAIDARESKSTSLELARKQLKSSEINIYEFTSVEEMHNKSQQDFETAKNNFRIAYAMLEEAVGIKLDKFKKQVR